MRPIAPQIGSSQQVGGFGLGLTGAFAQPAGAAAGDAAPPIPSTATSLILCSLFNWFDPPAPRSLLTGVDQNPDSLATPPYGLNWADYGSGDQLLAEWRDQIAGQGPTSVTGSPTVDVSGQQIALDGGGSMRDGLSINLPAFTVYLLFRLDGLGDHQFLLANGDFAATAGAFKLATGGSSALTFAVHGGAGASNSSTLTVPSTGWQWACVTVNTEAPFATQVVLTLNDSLVGTQSGSDLNEVSAGPDRTYLGADHTGFSGFMTGKLRHYQINSGVDTAEYQTQMYERAMYLQTQLA